MNVIERDITNVLHMWTITKFQDNVVLFNGVYVLNIEHYPKKNRSNNRKSKTRNSYNYWTVLFFKEEIKYAANVKYNSSTMVQDN